MKLIEQKTKLPIIEVKLDNVDDETFNYSRHSDLFPRKNIRAIFVGPSNCGKTCALLSLIYHKEGVSFKNIYIFSKSLHQPKYQELAEVMWIVPEIGFHPFSSSEKVPSPDNVKPYSIMIFDDIACELKSHMRS